MDDILQIIQPENPLPLVFDSPHSGQAYPDDFDFACDFNLLRAAEDRYVDDLFAAAPAYGAALLCAHFPRSYIDVNRRIDDIDPELLDAPWAEPHPINPTSRAHAGIGLIRRLVKPGLPVYDRKLTSAEILHRIQTYYIPYHNELLKLLKDLHYDFGEVWHINCHSMPEASAYPKRGIGLIGNKAQPSDFVLGDRDGVSCSHEFTRALRDFIKNLGYTVTVNDPFKGVELVDRYSSPSTGYHSLQIEINQALFMDEQSGEKSSNYNALQADVHKVIGFCAEFVSARLVNLAAD